MDNSFPYSTDAKGLQKNFYPYSNEPIKLCKRVRPYSPSNCIQMDVATYRDYDPLYIPPNVMLQLQSNNDMNTPKIPRNPCQSTEYTNTYELTAPKISGYSTMNREGYYMDVKGRPARTTLNFPYVLQVYMPKPYEQTFQTKESALTMAPTYGEWQIVNIFTGQRVYNPYHQNSHSYVCN